MNHYAITRREAHMIIYGLICAAVDEEIAGHHDRHDEFTALAEKINEWVEEAEHNGNSR